MNRFAHGGVLLALAVAPAGAATAQQNGLVIGGPTYTKWLWSNSGPADRRSARELEKHH